MRIVVAGIGGVGGYIGAHLCRLDDEVVFLARGAHADEIRQKGLTVKEDEGSFTAHPEAVVSAGELEGEIDLLLLCVKSYDIEPLLAELSRNITPSTVILPFANGVEHKEMIESLVEAKVLHGTVYILAHRDSDGVVVKKGRVFAAVFGADEHPGETAAVAALFEKAGLRYKTPEKIEEALWKKYLFISAFAALTAYFDIGIRRVCELHRNWAHTLLNEIADVAEAKGIDVREEVEKALTTASTLPEDASSSMHLDFKNGKRTELESLCGYVVREGKKLRLPTPLMAKIYGVLKEKAKQ